MNNYVVLYRLPDQPIDDYEIEINTESHTAEVSHGKFRGDLHELERTGVLKAPSGKTFKVPAWQIGDIANLAYQNGL